MNTRREVWRKRHGHHWIRDDKRHAIYHRDGDACVWCDASEDLTLGHVIPRSLGGSNEADNLVTECFDCNRRRYNRPIQEWSTPDRRAVALQRAVFVDINREERRVAARKAERAAVNESTERGIAA